jgi:hypothetical protein
MSRVVEAGDPEPSERSGTEGWARVLRHTSCRISAEKSTGGNCIDFGFSC